MSGKLARLSCIRTMACVLVASTFLAAASARQSSAPQTPANAGDPASASLFVRMCSDCHDSERIVSPRRTQTEWEDIINKMIEKGAVGTDKEFESVFAYLLLNYGKTYINKATADEITKILGLSKKDADAIVAYRTAKGPFADLDAVKKVPDLDLKKLDEHKDAIAF
jgi:competence protein ComEA